MVMPADPTADLVVIESRLPIASREHLLDAMPLPLSAPDFDQGDFETGIAQSVVGSRLADGTNDHEAFFGSHAPVFLGLDPGRQHFDVQWSLLAATDGLALPTRLGLILCPSVNALKGCLGIAAATRLAGGGGGFQIAHQRIARDGQDVAVSAAAQLGAELGGSAEFVIADDPAKRQAHQAPVQKIE